MILKDFKCKTCDEITEFLVRTDPVPGQQVCPICNGYAEKIFSVSFTAPVDSAWVSSVLEVVDKHSTDPHCTEFLKHPTRSNYKNWMKGEGLRPLEPGEKVKRPNQKARRERTKKVLLDNHMERNAITI